jgi:hypothetical protein
MIRSRHLRLLTVLIVVCISAYTISRAVTLLRFALADSSTDARGWTERLSPFVGEAPVSPLARARLLQRAPSEDTSERVDEFRELLAETPADGASWLGLARAQLADGAPSDKVVKSLAMSSLTGPNEALIMVGRAMFTLPLWAIAPAEARRVLIADLIGGWVLMSWDQRNQVRTILQEAPEDMRQQIISGLLLAGKDGTQIARVLNLVPPSGAKGK